MRGRLSREKWWVALFGGSGHYYIAERFVDGKRQEEYVDAHCLACAKTEILTRHGGQVDLRGWHMAPGMCGAFLKAMAMTVDEEDEDSYKDETEEVECKS